MDFEPKIPTTAEEAKEALSKITPGHEGITSCLIGIFECEIGMGTPLLKAYEAALLAYIDNTGSARKSSQYGGRNDAG